MERIAVFVDDAAHARRLLEPMLAPAAGPTHWVVVACAPRLTHRIGKWVAHSSREQWRERWNARLREQLEPLFPNPDGAALEWLIARGPLDRIVARLQGRFGAGLRVLDARRPKLGMPPQPLTAAPAPTAAERWGAPVAISSSLSLMLALTD